MKRLVFLLFIALIACKKSRIANPSPFSEKWIEISTKTDTIFFDPALNMDETRMFILNRGKEMRNGYLQPKIGSGIYTYKIASDTMSVLSGYSSCLMCFEKVKFTKSGNRLNIQNFYDPALKGNMQIFERIK